MFEIVDNNGVMYSGSREEMEAQFEEMTDENSEYSWDGDLKLVEVLNVYR